MSKSTFYFFILLIYFGILLVPVNTVAQDDEYEDSEEEYDEELSEITPADWALFLDLGYGQNGLSTTLGLRYWFFGASFGLTGFANDVPNYSTDLRQKPKPGDFSEERYTSLVVSGDLHFFYDIDKFTLHANAGYYSQADTVLAKAFNTGFYYYERKESVSGVTFGAGVDYLISQWITLGLGYHSKNGAYLQFGYRWD